tara:strand:- start:926 stop:1210 length:285 start_codon:yes stop_codon:yes gene_type:complete
MLLLLLRPVAKKRALVSAILFCQKIAKAISKNNEKNRASGLPTTKKIKNFVASLKDEQSESFRLATDARVGMQSSVAFRKNGINSAIHKHYFAF